MKPLQFEGAWTEQQRALFTAAFQQATQWVDRVNTDYLQWNAAPSSQAAFDLAVRTYFSNNAELFQRVIASTVRRLQAYMKNNEPLVVELNGEACDADTYAYTWFQGTQYDPKRLVFCDLSFDPHEVHQLASTVIHELTHALQNTDDHAYGEASSQRLSRRDLYKAVRNADNYGLFYQRYCQQLAQ